VPNGSEQCGQHSAQNRPAARIGECSTAGVLPHFSQARVFPLVRIQLRGPGVAGYIFRFGVITSGSAKRRLGAAIACIRPSDAVAASFPSIAIWEISRQQSILPGGVRQARREAIESGTGAGFLSVVSILSSGVALGPVGASQFLGTNSGFQFWRLRDTRSNPFTHTLSRRAYPQICGRLSRVVS